MKNKIKEMYNIQDFEANKDNENIGVLAGNLNELLKKVDIKIEANSFDDFVTLTNKATNKIVEAFSELLDVSNLTIYSEKGKILLGKL